MVRRNTEAARSPDAGWTVTSCRRRRTGRSSAGRCSSSSPSPTARHEILRAGCADFPQDRRASCAVSPASPSGRAGQAATGRSRWSTPIRSTDARTDRVGPMIVIRFPTTDGIPLLIAIDANVADKLMLGLEHGLRAACGDRKFQRLRCCSARKPSDHFRAPWRISSRTRYGTTNGISRHQEASGSNVFSSGNCGEKATARRLLTGWKP